MTEDVEIIEAPNGKLIARLVYNHREFTLDLPEGFAQWKDSKQRFWMKHYVVPGLKAFIARSRLTVARYQQNLKVN